MEKEKKNQIDKYGLNGKVVNAVKKIKQNKEIGNEGWRVGFCFT